MVATCIARSWLWDGYHRKSEARKHVRGAQSPTWVPKTCRLWGSGSLFTLALFPCFFACLSPLSAYQMHPDDQRVPRICFACLLRILFPGLGRRLAGAQCGGARDGEGSPPP